MYNAYGDIRIKLEVVPKMLIFSLRQQKKGKKILKEPSCKNSKENIREKWLHSMLKYIMKLQ